LLKSTREVVMGLVVTDDGWRIPDRVWAQMEPLLPPPVGLVNSCRRIAGKSCPPRERSTTEARVSGGGRRPLLSGATEDLTDRRGWGRIDVPAPLEELDCLPGGLIGFVLSVARRRRAKRGVKNLSQPRGFQQLATGREL
jgi:hypothetical protein